MNYKIISFLQGTGTDSKNRTLKEIFLMDHQEMENCHDYIQWLFPSMYKSSFNKEAPILDYDTVIMLQKDKLCMENIKLITKHFIQFLKGNSQKPFWIEIRNHNYQRISRALNFLRIVDTNLLNELYDFVYEYYKLFPNEIGFSITHWKMNAGKVS